jgi:polysaccharide pyruvyl transferase WcaK-like protein
LRWFDGFRALKGAKMLIIPGTGLLTDAYGLRGWGPYNLLKWSLIAKLRACKIFFLSVGAGPIYTPLGRFFVKSALSIAEFRSYRDEASRSYLNSIGFQTKGDLVYPDLVFSLPEITLPRNEKKPGGRVVVGLGLMEYAGRYSVERPSNRIYLEYLDNLVVFSQWLLAHDYDIRLLIGEVGEDTLLEEFKSLLKTSYQAYDEKRILDQPARSVQQLVSQIAATNLIVATRFHNVLLALILNKPVIAVSFHHKCSSLMSDIGLAEYCHDINRMNSAKLIQQFQDLEKNAEKLKPGIRRRVEQSRNALDQQYKLVFADL